MRFSIVTVCYNAENEIEETIRSVLEQNYVDYEYVFVDGKSTDKTNIIINSYINAFKQKGINIRCISEPDKGVYDAMNKGIYNAMGEWIIFMNAGDGFYNRQVLSKVSKLIDLNSSVDILYGDTCVIDKNLYQIRRAGETEELLKHMPFFHQSVFVRKGLLRSTLFDINYKICADYNMFLGYKKSNKVFIYLNDIVSFFAIGGLSASQKCLAIEEMCKIKNLYGELFSLKKEKRKVKSIKLKEKLKWLIPRRILYLKNRYILGWKPIK